MVKSNSNIDDAGTAVRPAGDREPGRPEEGRGQAGGILETNTRTGKKSQYWHCLALQSVLGFFGTYIEPE